MSKKYLDLSGLAYFWAQVKSLFSAHKDDAMPHRFIDGTTTYKYGFSVVDGVVTFNYEELP